MQHCICSYLPVKTISSFKMEVLQENMKLLLDCLHYQQDSVSSQKQALSTIAAMCGNNGTLCDHFRITGGLKYVMHILFETKSPELQIAAMYTLGCSCEQNMVSQRELCDHDVFTFLRDLLIVDSNKGVKLTAAYFATCLMNGNVAGQNLAREMRVIESLIVLYKQLHPSGNKLQHTMDDGNLTEDAKLFIGISSALCTAANNPQNELNQNLCSWILPAALSIFTPATPFQINFIRSAATLISACVANNNVVQERLRILGGLHTCVEALKALIPYATNAHKSEAVAHIIKIIFTATADVKSCRTLSMLSTASVFLKLLQIKSVEVSTKLNTVICLGMIAEGCAESRSVVREVGLPILIDLMVLSKNDELSRATTLVIKSCMETGEQCVNSEDADTYNAVERTVMMEAVGISPLNKVALQALDEKKLSLNDNISQWLTTTDLVIGPLDKNGKCRQEKSNPEGVTHSSQGSRQSFQKPSSPALVSLKPLLQKKSQCDLHSGPKRATCSRVMCDKECTVNSGSCSNGKARKVLHNMDHGMLQQQMIPRLKNANFTPTNELLYVPQIARSNIRYSVRQQPAHVFSRQCLHPCDFIPHQTAKSAVNQCVGQQCMGCTPSQYPLLLTSRNFCSQLQYDTHICAYHNQLLAMLNGTISQQQSVGCVPAPVNDRSGLIDQNEKKGSVHSSIHHLVQGENIRSDSSRHQQSKIDTSVVKLAVSSCRASKHASLSNTTNVSLNISQSLHQLPCAATGAAQRKHAKFTEEETQCLITGVRTFGKRWHYILAAYPFNPSRTALDLKDQYHMFHAQ